MKILNILTIKHLKANKKRTILTIIAIMLATFLMTELGLLFSSFRDNGIQSTIKYNGYYAHSSSTLSGSYQFKNDGTFRFVYQYCC